MRSPLGAIAFVADSTGAELSLHPAEENQLAKKKKVVAPPEKTALYMRLLAATPGVEDRSNFGSAYTAVNGNMYSMISKYGVVGIRLPEAEREAFLQKYRAEIFRADPAWPPSKEYVAVPDDLLEQTDVLAPYLKRSLEYASSLRPKGPKKPP